MGTSGLGVQPARAVGPKPHANASSALFEASLRNFCRPYDDRRKAWNPSCRIAYKSKVLEPHGSREALQLIQPFESPKCAPKTKAFAPTLMKSSPPIWPQSVKLSARCQPSNDNTSQAMEALKTLVDNFVRKLFSGDDNFDEKALEELRMRFKSIQQNSMANQDEGQNGSNVVQNNACSSQQTLYQTVMWCIVFQACIDVLSKPNEICSVDLLLHRSWKYLENMRSILEPFVVSEEEKHAGLHSRVNMNQSNRADFFEENDAISSHVTEPIQSWDSYASTISAASSLPLVESTKATEVHRKTYNSRSQQQASESSCKHRRQECRELCCEKWINAFPGTAKVEHSSAVSQSYLRDARVGTENQYINRVPEKGIRVPLGVSRPTQATSCSNKGIQTSTPQGHLLSTKTAENVFQEPEPEGLRREYESTRRELAVEADRYLDIFKRCQNLQRTLRYSTRTGNTEDTEDEEEEMNELSLSLIERSHMKNYKPCLCTSAERGLQTKFDETKVLLTRLRFVPRISYEPDTACIAVVRHEAVCMISIIIPLLSLIDLQWLLEQFKRSESSHRFRQRRHSTRGDKLVRALPFKCSCERKNSLGRIKLQEQSSCCCSSFNKRRLERCL
ncbi:hypothetical protein AAHC03_026476 [Spirometra sp. Aus1]